MRADTAEDAKWVKRISGEALVLEFKSGVTVAGSRERRAVSYECQSAMFVKFKTSTGHEWVWKHRNMGTWANREKFGMPT